MRAYSHSTCLRRPLRPFVAQRCASTRVEGSDNGRRAKVAELFALVLDTYPLYFIAAESATFRTPSYLHPMSHCLTWTRGRTGEIRASPASRLISHVRVRSLLSLREPRIEPIAQVRSPPRAASASPHARSFRLNHVAPSVRNRARAACSTSPSAN